jgi:hypothetical protein
MTQSAGDSGSHEGFDDHRKSWALVSLSKRFGTDYVCSIQSSEWVRAQELVKTTRVALSALLK